MCCNLSVQSVWRHRHEVWPMSLYRKFSPLERACKCSALSGFKFEVMLHAVCGIFGVACEKGKGFDIGISEQPVLTESDS